LIFSDKPKLRIAEDKDFSPDVVKELQRDFEVDLAPCKQEDLQVVLETCDAFWFRLGFHIHKGLFTHKNRCKVIATPVTGIDHIDEETCKKWGIQIVCLRGETEFLQEVRATAEMTIALTLALLRHLVPAANHTLQGHWDRDLFRGQEIYKKTVGIVGMGRLGRITGSYFQAMGARVIGYDKREDFPQEFEQAPSLTGLIDASDIISIHLSYNADTKGMFDSTLFRHFSKDKILVNTARGGIVDEAALLASLQEGRLGGAALDVLQHEDKISADHPLLAYARQYSNLLIVPHIGGNTYESFKKTEEFIAQKIKAAYSFQKQ
jgi:D-3-phosphoglycerate dehydrogenase